MERPGTASCIRQYQCDVDKNTTLTQECHSLLDNDVLHRTATALTDCHPTVLLCATNLLSLDGSYGLSSAYSFIKPSYKKSRAICTLSCECQGFSFPPTCPRHHDETFGFQVPQTDAHMACVASHNGGSGAEGGCGALLGGPDER